MNGQELINYIKENNLQYYDIAFELKNEIYHNSEIKTVKFNTEMSEVETIETRLILFKIYEM